MNFKRFIFCVMTCLFALGATAQSARVTVHINPGDLGVDSRYPFSMAWKNAISTALASSKLEATTRLSFEAQSDLSAVRARLPDVVAAPAHIIGAAIRNGYTPVLGFDRPFQGMLVVPTDSQIKDLASAKDSRMGVPHPDSLLAYLLRGELHAANTTFKQHFAKDFYETRHLDALLICLNIRSCDAVWVDRGTFDKWLGQGAKVRGVMVSKAVPFLSVALKDGSKPGVDVFRNALMETLQGVAGSDNARTLALSAKDFEYVSTLGYFTPRDLPGAVIVDSQKVSQLLAAKAVFVDTRNDAEFRAGHVPGAVLVPYVEKSAKAPDYNPAEDNFDLSKLPLDRKSPLIFSCNGPECWKSYKASVSAIKAGYKAVHWFRGGFPEWRVSGQQVAL